MTTTALYMASTNQLKRPYSEVDLNESRQDVQTSPPPAMQDPKQLLSPSNLRRGNCDLLPSTPGRSMANSPGPNTPGSTVGDGPATIQSGPPASIESAPKKRKLTSAEKESKRLEKETKDRLKAEGKSRKETEKQEKEVEKRKKEEEVKEQKRIKEEEKEEKRRAKEAEKQLKEEERKQKEVEKKAREEEKHKKDKSQLRLNAFFAKPPLPASGATGSDLRGDSPCSRRSSIASIEGNEASTRSRSNSVSAQQPLQSNYERSFPPFFLQSHTELAPYNRFLRDEKGLQIVRNRIDESLERGEDRQHSLQRNHPLDAATLLLHLPANKRMRHDSHRTTVKEIIARLYGTVDHPIDLTVVRPEASGEKHTHWLKMISTKYLKFAEDVRPPYIGTYSKIPAECTVSKLCRNPFTRGLPRTNYDYDSEAEWEEPGEGEDLDSEGEEELGEDEDGDEMDGFLDDEDAGDGIGGAGNRRRFVIGDLEPVSTGLCWDDGQGRLGGAKLNDAHSTLDLRPFRLEVMLDTIQTPIDPYSTAYWPSPTRPTTTTTPSTMHPPRLPLHTIHPSNTLTPSSALSTFKPHLHSTSKSTSTPAKGAKALKTVAPELMAEFKTAIQGSDLTKAGLIEILKKQFPKTSKDAIKDTLGLVAERVGSKEADKRWVIKEQGGF